MGRGQTGVLTWNIDEVAKALKITTDEVKEYFTDGRRASFILERILSRELLHGRLSEFEGASYDLVNSAGGKWEVRSISKEGIYFCPSYMVEKRRFGFKYRNIKKKSLNVS